jgi:hypothetical protein
LVHEKNIVYATRHFFPVGPGREVRATDDHNSIAGRGISVTASVPIRMLNELG